MFKYVVNLVGTLICNVGRLELPKWPKLEQPTFSWNFRSSGPRLQSTFILKHNFNEHIKLDKYALRNFSAVDGSKIPQRKTQKHLFL